MIEDYLAAFSALLFILALLFCFAWAAKRFGMLPGQPQGKGTTKQIEIIENRILDSRNRLIVIKWKNNEYLLSSNANGLKLISSTQTKAAPGDFEKMVDDYAERN